MPQRPVIGAARRDWCSTSTVAVPHRLLHVVLGPPRPLSGAEARRRPRAEGNTCPARPSLRRRAGRQGSSALHVGPRNGRAGDTLKGRRWNLTKEALCTQCTARSGRMHCGAARRSSQEEGASRRSQEDFCTQCTATFAHTGDRKICTECTAYVSWRGAMHAAIAALHLHDCERRAAPIAALCLLLQVQGNSWPCICNVRFAVFVARCSRQWGCTAAMAASTCCCCSEALHLQCTACSCSEAMAASTGCCCSEPGTQRLPRGAPPVWLPLLLLLAARPAGLLGVGPLCVAQALELASVAGHFSTRSRAPQPGRVAGPGRAPPNRLGEHALVN